MNPRLSELHLKRGRLLERIATQRAALRRDAQPVRASLAKADHVVARIRSVTDYIRQHPGIAGLAVAGLLAIRAECVWRWSRRAFLAWRTWRAFSDKLSGLGLRAHS